MCVITFHSLEDRLVKQRFRQWRHGLHLPAGVPGVRMRREGQGKAHYQKAR